MYGHVGNRKVVHILRCPLGHIRIRPSSVCTIRLGYYIVGMHDTSLPTPGSLGLESLYL